MKIFRREQRFLKNGQTNKFQHVNKMFGQREFTVDLKRLNKIDKLRKLQENQHIQRTVASYAWQKCGEMFSIHRQLNFRFLVPHQQKSSETVCVGSSSVRQTDAPVFHFSMCEWVSLSIPIPKISNRFDFRAMSLIYMWPEKGNSHSFEDSFLNGNHFTATYKWMRSIQLARTHIFTMMISFPFLIWCAIFSIL